MAHFVGKINLNKLIGVKIADVEYGDEVKKCLVIPINDNDIVKWKDEWQLWFRAMAYKEQKGSFSHFIMRFVRMGDIKRLSQEQIEKFMAHSIGGMKKSSFDNEPNINNIKN